MAIMRGNHSDLAGSMTHATHRSLETGIRENGEDTRRAFDLLSKVSENVRKTASKHSRVCSERKISSEYVDQLV